MSSIMPHEKGAVVVATDFSQSSVNAASQAAAIALGLNKELILLHIVILQVSFGEASLNLNIDEMVQDAWSELENLKNQLKQQTGRQLSIRAEVRTGSFFTELKDACDRLKPYLVIMGSQGTTAAERLVFGGHTVYAMKHLNWSLMTIPATAAPAAIRNIGLACDFENSVQHLPVEALKTLVNDFNARLHILHVQHKAADQQQVAFEFSLLEQQLKDINPVYHFEEAGNIDEGIIHFARKQQLDLLVVLPKKHNLLDAITHRSHTKELVLNAPVPLMTIH